MKKRNLKVMAVLLTAGMVIPQSAAMIGNVPLTVQAEERQDTQKSKQEDEKGVKVISSEMMDVYVDEKFPSVKKYEMKGDLSGKTFYGQTEKIHTVTINGTDIALDDSSVKSEFSGNKASYTMTLKAEEQYIDAVVTAELAVEKNIVTFKITDIKNNKTESTTNKYGQKVETYPIETIAIPDHSLISVRTTQENANLKGAIMSSHTKISGDELIEVNSEMKEYTDRDYMYAFLSDNEMSAGLWSNSEHEGRSAYTVVTGGGQNTRVFATSKDMGDYKTMGLASAPWYYHRNIEDSHGVEYTVEESEMPEMKVIITGDMNDDTQINWQDGAVAFREIMNNPYKCEEVPELVAWRVSMNFGSQAQNPFLTTLDNVKRVAQHTDGLGQSIILKGYASEGHDSGHPDYGNIGERMGGAEDMNTLLEKGAEYGARFGVHVNASEMYPEAKAFSEDSVRRYTEEDSAVQKNPELLGTLRYGWNWLDQGVGIDAMYDLGTKARESRFDQLKEKVGDRLDFIYVDVWGNQTASRTEDSWETRHLTDEITDNGWRMTTEWGSGNEYDSTFQHWAADLTYGGYDKKGENSEVMRFLRNHQKDSWIGDYPNYEGAANAPLLGGYSMKDFEGWQGRNDYDAYITNLYTHDLTTKFLQHYKVMKWIDGDPVVINKKGETWTPEKEITLKDDDGNVVVATRESTDPANAAYRNRTITLNGKVISKGAVSRGDNGKDGTETYLLPWIWDSQTGKKVAPEEEKMYHWNTTGGTTTWELQDGWKSLENVKVYKLTDLGKTEEQTIPVTDGMITLNAEAQTPYVVCKGEKGNLDITWSEGMHMTDVGFNSGEAGLDSYWVKEGDGTAAIAKSQYNNPMLKLDGEVSVTQKITDLVPGKNYVVYIGVDNRSDSKAAIEVKSGDAVLDSNYTKRSIAKNYVKAYTHSNSSATVGNSSYFQNMYAFFTAPEDGSKVTLTLSKEAGDGSVYFDDVRIVESDMNILEKDADGNGIKMYQDFENNVQGIYPFVIGPIEGVEDNRTHLSELHDPVTQAGWDVKKVDDVIDGNWSVKSNGLAGKKLVHLTKTALVYQTIPQNFRFKPGEKYKISFDYQAGEKTYAVTTGDGEFKKMSSMQELPKAMGKDNDGHFEMELTGAESGETWFGIYSTGNSPDMEGTSGSIADFGGYKDFILDNLKIEIIEKVDKTALKAAIDEAAAIEKGDYTEASWQNLQEKLAAAQEVFVKEDAGKEEVDTALANLNEAIEALQIKEIVSTEVLKATIELAEKADTENVIDSVMEKYNTTLANAKEILAKAEVQDESVTQSQVDNAWKELLKVLEYMELKKGDKTQLQELVKIAGELDLDIYITAGKEEFQNALQEAERVISDGDAMQQEVNDAYDQLLGAMNQLVKKGDKTNLNKVIELAEEKAGKLDQYMEAGKQEFLDALEEAKKVRDNADAVQEQVDEAWNNLLTKMEKLKLIPNKEALEELIHSVQNMDLSIYTEQSQKEINVALADAIEVYENQEATQEEVDQAVEKLQKAVDHADKQPGEDQDDQPGSGQDDQQGSDQGGQQGSGQDDQNAGSQDDHSGNQSNGQADQSKNNVPQKSVKTGDNTHTALFVLGMAAAAAAVIAEERNRRRKK